MNNAPEFYKMQAEHDENDSMQSCISDLIEAARKLAVIHDKEMRNAFMNEMGKCFCEICVCVRKLDVLSHK